MTHAITNGNSVGSNGLDEWAGFQNMGYSWTTYYYKHVTFDSNGGTGSMDQQTIENSGTLTASTMTRDGYVFAGWNTAADGSGTFYPDGAAITATSEDKGLVKLYAQWLSLPNNLTGEFMQKDHKVKLVWNAISESSPLGGKFVVYRNDTKIGVMAHMFNPEGTPGLTFEDTNTNAETDFPYESNITYDVYLVPEGMDEDTKLPDCKSSVTVSTTRTVPVSTPNATGQDDRIVFTWTSDGYPAGWGNQFKIYVDDETEPIYTITPTEGQTSFQWEHRRDADHNERQSGVTNGIHWTSQSALDVCSPHDYRIEGVIGSVVLNSQTFENKSIGGGTLFNSIDATKGVYPGIVKLAWNVTLGKEGAKTYIVKRKRAEKDEAWTELYRTSSADAQRHDGDRQCGGCRRSRHTHTEQQHTDRGRQPDADQCLRADVRPLRGLCG